MEISPTVRRWRLGSTLRQLREQAELTIDQAAAVADMSKSTLSRVENAQAGIRVPQLRALLEAYGVEPEQIDYLIRLARDARERGWWEDYSNVVSSDAATYIGFESEAVSARVYETSTVPGLLQTEAYARAILEAFAPLRPEQATDRHVKLRITRQQRLEDLDYWAIVEESAITRPIGGRDVARQQLEHLLAASSRPNVTLQVIPHSAEAHPGIDGPFNILELRGDYGSVVTFGYIETRVGGVWIDRSDDVRGLSRVFDHLRASALDVRASAARVRQIMEEL